MGYGGGAGSYALSANGTLVFFGGEGTTGDRTFVAVSRSGTTRSLGTPFAFYGTPRVSPDGRQIAVPIGTNADALLANPDIWRFDMQSKTLTRLTTRFAQIAP